MKKKEITAEFTKFLQKHNVAVLFMGCWKKEYTGPINDPRDYADNAFIFENTKSPDLWVRINEAWQLRLNELNIY